MNDTVAKPAEQPANLSSLHRELLDLAARPKQAKGPAEDRVREIRGPVIVIRGK